MKGIQFQILFAIILLVLALIVVFVWGGNIGNMLVGIKWSDKVLQNNVDNQEKELQSIYDDYKNNDGGFDAYEISIILAKAIEFTWNDCYNLCKDERELFTGFFLKNPIDFSKNMDCGSYPASSGDKVYPSIGKISGWCSTSDLGVDKTKKADEWTVTIWGLGNTAMCSNYKLSSNEGSKQWGNSNCGSMDVSKGGKKCADSCDKSGAGIDKIDWQAGEIQKGSKYGNIRIIYTPNAGAIMGIGGEPKIIVREISA